MGSGVLSSCLSHTSPCLVWCSCCFVRVARFLQLNGVYQTAQNMAAGHLCHKCVHVPDAVRQQLLFLKEKKSSAGAGRKYWSEGARVLGVFEVEGFGLRFRPRQNDLP
jgi:hypothetical protein